MSLKKLFIGIVICTVSTSVFAHKNRHHSKFRKIQKVEVCFIHPGQPDRKKQLSIPVQAVPFFLSRGAVLGLCSDIVTDGGVDNSQCLADCEQAHVDQIGACTSAYDPSACGGDYSCEQEFLGYQTSCIDASEETATSCKAACGNTTPSDVDTDGDGIPDSAEALECINDVSC